MIGLGGRGKYVQLIGVQQAFHRAYTLQLSNDIHYSAMFILPVK
jgi:hypothetical protein